MRKKRGIGRLALLAAALASSACSSQSSPDPRAALQQMVTEKWAAYGDGIGYPSTGGAALFVSTPAGDYFASTGMDNASPGIHFRVASNTKTFTAAAIMLLQQRGLLDIDDLVTANMPGRGAPYLPDSPGYAIPFKGSITIRQLLNHTAGVFDITNDDIPTTAPCSYAGKSYIQTQDMSRQFTFDELVGVVATCRASYWAPSENRFHYSNTGYTLLGKVIESVSGMPYGDFVVRNLVAPNQLTDTSLPSLSTQTTIPPPFAVGNSIDYMGSGRLTVTTSDNMSFNVAEGNVISTPEQLARWNRALLTGRSGVDRPGVDRMKCTVPAGANSCYGLGIEQRTGLGFGHTGAHNGYLSVMSYDPDNDVSIVLFFSLIDFRDLNREGAVLLDVVTQARAILGY
jgi:D-alanyl-D-alanine carboxypeptidase